MTSIGRFSLHSETVTHPSLPTFFVALAGPPKNNRAFGNNDKNKDDGGMSVTEFINLWNRKEISKRHPRFHSSVSPHDSSYFEFTTPDLPKHIMETMPYSVPRLDLQHRIQAFLINSKKLDLHDKLWEAHITNGPIGASGAISKQKIQELQQDDNQKNDTETVILFRSHHCIGDGVSLAAALMDLSDESELFKALIRSEMKKRRLKKPKGMLQKLLKLLKGLVWFWIGSIKAFMYQGYMHIMAPMSPFQFILDQYENEHDRISSKNSFMGRSVSWCDAAPLSEVTQVAKTLYPKATVNDLFVTCVSAAVRRQIAYHISQMKDDQGKVREPPSHINVVMPVHLMGGVLPPGYSLSNKIGALAARVPATTVSSNKSPLEETSQTLSYLKRTPTPLLSHIIAQFVTTYLPSNIATYLFAKSTSNAAFTLSNVRGPSQCIHWNGRPVISMGGFVPLPPGMYVGVAVQSYNGTVSLTLNADKRVIPDADLFMEWILEEYVMLCREAEKKKLSMK